MIDLEVLWVFIINLLSYSPIDRPYHFCLTAEKPEAQQMGWMA